MNPDVINAGASSQPSEISSVDVVRRDALLAQRSVIANYAESFQRFTTPRVASRLLQSCLPELSQGLLGIKKLKVLDAKLKSYLKPQSKVKSTLSACYQVTIGQSGTGESSQRL